jgi:regulatory protein
VSTATSPAAGASPAGRARRASGADDSDLVSWAVPGVTDAPGLASDDVPARARPGGRAGREPDGSEPAGGGWGADHAEPDSADGSRSPGGSGGNGGRRKGRRKRGEPVSPEERAERAERASQARQAELDADPEAVARQICLRLLTSAPRTRAQLADALRKRGVPEHAAETVLERFADVQLIDDAMFAQAWVDSRHYGRGLARRALAAELRQRGVAAEEIRTAVDRVDPDQELATAQALVERRLAGTRGLARQARFRRLMGMLARKGYSEGLAYRVVRAALDSEESDAVRYLDRMAGRDATPGELMDADRFGDRLDEPEPEPEPEAEPDDNADSW